MTDRRGFLKMFVKPGTLCSEWDLVKAHGKKLRMRVEMCDEESGQTWTMERPSPCSSPCRRRQS